MKRALLWVMILAVCGMMVAPVAMAGKPDSGGGSKYSTISNDIVAGPTADRWTNGVHWSVYPPTAGPMTVYHPNPDYSFANGDDAHGKYIYWPTHGESLIMFDAKGNWINPNKMAQRIYYLPGDNAVSELHFNVMMDGVPNPKTGTGEPATICLTFMCDLHRLPSGEQLTLTVTKNQVQLSGTDITFFYDDWHRGIDIDKNGPRYGTAQHSFELAIDK